VRYYTYFGFKPVHKVRSLRSSVLAQASDICISPNLCCIVLASCYLNMKAVVGMCGCWVAVLERVSCRVVGAEPRHTQKASR
jgi:hypothetical protein